MYSSGSAGFRRLPNGFTPFVAQLVVHSRVSAREFAESAFRSFCRNLLLLLVRYRKAHKTFESLPLIYAQDFVLNEWILHAKCVEQNLAVNL